VEDSPSSDGWDSFKRQAVSCIRRAPNRPSVDTDTVQTVRETFQSSYADDTPSAKSFISTGWAPPHWGLIVRESPNKTFPNEMGVMVQSRGPYVTRLDFFFWVYIKD
jgi:hypothetical protein